MVLLYYNNSIGRVEILYFVTNTLKVDLFIMIKYRLVKHCMIYACVYTSLYSIQFSWDDLKPYKPNIHP